MTGQEIIDICKADVYEAWKQFRVMPLGGRPGGVRLRERDCKLTFQTTQVGPNAVVQVVTKEPPR